MRSIVFFVYGIHGIDDSFLQEGGFRERELQKMFSAAIKIDDTWILGNLHRL
jgi:hypothetical protein